MNILLSIEPEQGFFIVIGIIAFGLFIAILSKFFQIASDVREIRDLLKMRNSEQNNLS